MFLAQLALRQGCHRRDHRLRRRSRHRRQAAPAHARDRRAANGDGRRSARSDRSRTHRRRHAVLAHRRRQHRARRPHPGRGRGRHASTSRGADRGRDKVPGLVRRSPGQPDRAGAHRGHRGDAGDGRLLGGDGTHGHLSRCAGRVAGLARRHRDARSRASASSSTSATAASCRSSTARSPASTRPSIRSRAAARPPWWCATTAPTSNRDEEVEPPFERRSDSDIAEELFGRFEQIRETRIEGSEATPETTTRRGTVLEFLRQLALASDRHAYVLPGDEPGASIGCFLPDPEGATELPPLVMIGDDRNLADATVTEDPDGAERTQAQLLRTDDQGVATFETSPEDLGPDARPAGRAGRSHAATAAASGRQHARRPERRGHGAGTPQQLRLPADRPCRSGLLPRRADAVQQGARRRRRHAVQRRLPDYQGRSTASRRRSIPRRSRPRPTRSPRCPPRRWPRRPARRNRPPPPWGCSDGRSR